MGQNTLSQPPRKDDGRFDDWIYRLWKRIAGAGQILWTQIDLTGSNFVGDSGSGGTKGTVPAPAAGDATKYLKGDGTWATVTQSQNQQSANYTCVLSDAEKQILHPSADTSARTFTIPANSSVPYQIGTKLKFINQNGAGVVTISIVTDTMRLVVSGATGSRTLAANGVATAQKITATEWIIYGNGLT